MHYIRSVIVSIVFLYAALLSSLAFSNTPTITIQEDFSKLENFNLEYYIDKTQEMSLQAVQQQDFQMSSNRISLGESAKTIWIKIQLKNESDQPFSLYLHQPEMYHNHQAHLYEITNGNVVSERLIDTNNKDTHHWMYRGAAVFDITLPAQEYTTLYIKSRAFSYQWLSLYLYNEDQSKRALLGQQSDTILLVGMLLSLILYNLFLFITSRFMEHLYYSLYLTFGCFWISLTYGLLADAFNVFGSMTLKWHISLGAMPVFLLLFMATIFETKKKYPIEHKALLAVIVLLVANAFYALFDIIAALRYSSTLAPLTILISLIVAVSMLIRKHPLALFFLLGHGLFVACSALSVLFYKGHISYTYLTSHGVGIGLVLEALALSLIIAYRIRILREIKETQEELQLQASTDPLTKLLNRRYLNIAANKVFDRSHESISVALIDIDNFKNINDTYGHTIGDKAIIHAAETLKSSCRGKDILARYGGEEFILIMPDTPIYAAKVITERVRVELERSKVYADQDQPIHFTISAGVTEAFPMETGLLDAIDQADRALYQAKNSGKNQTQLYKAKV